MFMSKKCFITLRYYNILLKRRGGEILSAFGLGMTKEILR